MQGLSLWVFFLGIAEALPWGIILGVLRGNRVRESPLGEGFSLKLEEKKLLR